VRSFDAADDDTVRGPSDVSSGDDRVFLVVDIPQKTAIIADPKLL